MPATSSISGLPGGLPSKGTASISVDQSAQPSPAQLSGLTHEAEDSPPPTATPLTIHSAAQRGDLHAIRTLIESGRAKATDRDEDNITPLHWASINAQVPTCQYLLDQGAEVDALGGDLVASPLQWAAR